MFERPRKLATSNYGREYGWFIELNGKVVGELVYLDCAEMFWDWYRVVPSSEDSAP